MSRNTVVIIGLICGAVGIAIGWGTPRLFSDDALSTSNSLTELRAGGFKFINPLLECQTESVGLRQELAVFRQTIQSEADRHKNKDVWHISVYFRDLNNGPWFGLNEQEKFAPASLLKVPVMLATFKEVEKTPGFLETKVRYVVDSISNIQNIRTGDALLPGETYTVRQLMEQMIRNSDNGALTTLSGALPENAFERVMEDFGMPLPTSTTADFLGVHRYAGFFRILFNASYLSRSASEDALKILSESSYKDGLVAGVPAGILVAHKFGERTLMVGNQMAGRQLHDCGIVYYPKRPYLLCVMTRGNDYGKLSAVIRDISATTYREVGAQLSNKN